jgi:large subunit ribosomal protein L3
MGGEKVKVDNLEVLEVIKEKNLLILKGSVPGPINSYITVQK